MKRLLLLLALFAGATRAQEPETAPPPGDLPSLLPAETMLVLEADDLGGFDRWSRETALGRIWAEPEMQQFVQGVRKSVATALERFGGGFDPLAMVGLDAKDFAGVAVRRYGLALVDANYTDRIEVDAVFTVQFRKGQENAERILTSFRRSLEQFLAVDFEDVTVAGDPAWRVSLPLGYELFFHYKDDRLLVTTTSARLEQVIGAVRNGHAGSLAQSPRFRTVAARMGMDRYAGLVYADLQRVVARATGAARLVLRPDHVDAFEHGWKKLGLDAMEALAFADIPQGTGFRTELAITLRERRGLFGLMPQGAPTHRFARFAPRDALAYGSEYFDLEATWNGVLGIVGSFSGSARADMERAVEEASAHLGVDVKKDVAAALGTEWAGYVGQPPGGGLVPDVVLFASLRDRARLEKALDAIAAKMPELVAGSGEVARPRVTHFRGTKIRYLELAGDDGDPRPVAPAWAFGDDFVVIGLFPQSVKHALLEKASITGNPAFGAMLRGLPKSTVSASYFDLQGVVGYLYNTLAPALQAVQGAINRRLGIYALEINLGDLPPASVLTRHLDGLMGYTAVENDCVRFGYVSSFGAPLMLVPVAVIAAGVAAGQSEARRAHRRAESHAAAAREREEAARMREENKMLRERLAEIEAKIAELRKQMAEDG